MPASRPGPLTQAACGVLVVACVVAFGVLAIVTREAELAAAWGLRPGMPRAFWWYVWRWPVETVGWLVLVWAATRRLAAAGSRLVHAPLAVGGALVGASVVSAFLDGPGLGWAGPVGIVDSDVPAFSQSWWWGVAGPFVVGGGLLAAGWLARRGARPSPAPVLRSLLEAGALVAIPLLSLAFGAVALTATALGLELALVESGLPFVLLAIGALAASGGGRTSTVAVSVATLLVVNLSLVWRPAAYLTVFAVACALALVPTARGIEWLTAPRRPIPADRPSVPERADADDRARA
ncbi:hypothetical protein [Cellulomonas terrae]|uniref:Uncharacterized protein n=1 Tax=Cellulomonas terrae TaxID=311234 RepID=A0A511JMD0_9CELL|nr:hypothetical protein [Cellulomonas terrae]GEL99172.1 hypothetical protein CTE05_27190 [Cellulomonas terrae]